MAAVGRSKNWANRKGPQGDRVRICTYKGKNMTTVESPNKGHFGTNINSSGLSTV